MDHISEFEKNVRMRLRDIEFHTVDKVRKPQDAKQYDFKASFLFLGIAMGVVSSNIACLCQPK